MKKITLFITLSLIMINFLSFSQKLSKDFTVTVAKPYQVIDAGSKEYLSLDDGTVIMVKMGRGMVHIQKFNINGMSEIKRNEYNDLPKGAIFQALIKLKDKVYYIYQVYNKKAKIFDVYSREINVETAKFENPKKIITTSRKVVNSPRPIDITAKGTGSFMGLKGYKFRTYKSFDNSKLLIQYRLHPVNKNDKINYDEIGFYVFDNNMDKIWGNELKMPYTEAQINNVAYAVSSKGKALMLVANREKKDYQLFTIDNGKLTQHDLGISTKQLVRKLVVKEGKDGNFVCGGFYANGIEFKMSFSGGTFSFNVNGLMYFVMDDEGSVSNKKNYDFTKEFIKQNLSDRQKKKVEGREAKGKAGIADLSLVKFIIKDNGSAYFIGERQWTRKEFYGASQQYVTHLSNVVVIKVTSDGELAWMKKLAKNQAGVNGAGQMGIAYMEGKDADYVAYIDNPKNIALDASGGVPVAHKDGLGGFLTTYKIDHNTGNLEKHTICDMKNIKGYRAYQFKPSRIIKAGSGIFLMEIYIKKKQDTMVKFELNN